MKKMILLLLFFGILLFGIQPTTSLSDKLRKHVFKLCTTPEPRNCGNLRSLNQAADYIKVNFAMIGLKVREQEYEVNGKTYRNIIGSIPKEHTKKIIIGAHYDVAGEQQGADDNASAVAGLIELARILSQKKDSLTNELEFVAFTLEEPPYFGTADMGSSRHAKSLKDAGEDIEYMLCLEMIGYYSDAKGSQDYPIKAMKSLYPDTGNFIAVVGNPDSAPVVKEVMECLKTHCRVPAQQLVAPALVKGVAFSDHANYWVHGYKAVMVTDTAFFRNKNYHKKTDTPETLDYQKMAQVVEGLAPLFFAEQKTNAERGTRNAEIKRNKIELNNYKHGKLIRIPQIPMNLSGITWSPKTNTLYAVMNSPARVTELTLEGKFKRSIDLKGFSDTEGITHVKDSWFAVVEEGRGTIVKFPIEHMMTAIPRDVCEDVTVYRTGTNQGLEGLCYDTSIDRFYTVKEKTPRKIFRTSFSGKKGELWNIEENSLGMNDLSGIEIDPVSGNLLILSDESKCIVECTAQGKEISRMKLEFTQPEGITIDRDGTIYVVGEPNQFQKFTRK